MGMNNTPAGERAHIGFFGRRNAGKSSLLNAVTGQELLDLGLGIRDYAVVGIGVILMFAVSMGGRTGCLREKISRRPYAIRYTVFLTLFFAVLLLGCYGANFDARQFIYNQF